MQVTLEGKTYEVEEFYDKRLPNALRKAQDYADKEGFVAGMPHLIEWRASDYQSPFWDKWYNTSTEEHIIPDSTGRFGKKGKQLVLVTQGDHGILTPERIEQAYRQGLVSGAAKLNPDECSRLLQSPLTIPYEEYNCRPEPYTLVLTQEQAKAYKSGRLTLQEFTSHPRVIAWAGGKKNLSNYFYRSQLNNQKVFFCYDSLTTDEMPRGRLLFQEDYHGLYSYGNFNDGRFVGVKALKVPHTPEIFTTKKPTTLYRSLDILTNEDINPTLQPVQHTTPPENDTPPRPTPIEINSVPDKSLITAALVVAGLGIATAGAGIAAIIYATRKQPTIVYKDVNGDGILDAILTEEKIIFGEKL